LQGLPPAAPFTASDRPTVPLVILAAICCLIGVWSIYATDLLGDDWQYFPLTIAAGMLGFISLFELRVGLAVLLLAIGLSPEFTLFGIPNFRYEDAVLPLLLMIWASQHVIKKGRLQPTDLKRPLLIIVFVASISSLNNYLYSDLDLMQALLYLGKNIEYYLIFLLVLNALHSRQDAKGFIFLMLLASLLVGIFGLTQWSLYGGTAGYRLPGPSGETANILGGYYVFHICLALGLLAHSRPKMRPILLIYLAIMLIPVALTLSRTSFVALLIGVGTIWLASRSSLLGIPILMMICGAIFVPDYVTERFSTVMGIFSGDSPSSWTARVAGWNHFIPAALERPLFGHGIGSGTHAVDNEYVLQLYNLGFIGLGAFLWLICNCLKTSFRLQKSNCGDVWISGFALGYFGGTVSLLAHSIGATTFTTIRTTEPFFFATGILYLCWNQHRKREKERQPYSTDEPLTNIASSIKSWSQTPGYSESSPSEGR